LGRSRQVGGLDEDDHDSGLVADHAYSVLELVEFPQKGLQLVKVQNPWRAYGWKGDFDATSPLWTRELLQACKYNPEINDGSFWMKFQDFADHFSFIGCCSTRPGWTFKTEMAKWEYGKTAGGREDATIHFNPTFVLETTGRQVIIQVDQDEIRDNSPVNMYYFDVFVNVLKHTESKGNPIPIDLSNTVVGYNNPSDAKAGIMPQPFRFHSVERVKAIEMDLEPGVYDVLLTRDWAGFKGEVAVNVWSDRPFQITPKKIPEPNAQEKAAMAEQKLRKDDKNLTCCMTGHVIDQTDPSSFEVQKGVFWHVKEKPKNYRCGNCLRSFDASVPFFDIAKDPKTSVWKGYCARCFKYEFFPKCLVCTKPIFDTPECAKCNGEFVRVPGGRVHAECWVELQLKQSPSNLVCPLTVKSKCLTENTIAVVCRISATEEALGKLKKTLDS